MKKIIILNYSTAEIIIVSIRKETLDDNGGDIEDCLIEHCVFYNNSTCYWMELYTDEFGNFGVIEDNI